MSSTFEKGKLIGRYELLLPLARGGMAEVWAARLHGTRGFQKLVAIKTMLPGVIEDERAERMFMDEAGLSSQIQHPNVVEIIELGEEDGTLYLVMEWIDGEPLNYILKRALGEVTIPLNVAVNLIGQCCKGLQAAHELKNELGEPLGVVHRDISPHNLLVTYSGTVKIVDFGIAKVTSQNVGLTEAGEIKGKLAYMSPEHVSGKPVDRRSDLFALGVVLYQLTTGEHPFRGETPAETVRNTTMRDPPPPSSHAAGYPLALERIVQKALAKDPEQRYATARDLLLDLQRAMPAALDHGADAKTATFLRGLLGERIQGKKHAIRKAIEASQFDPATSTLQVTMTNQSGTMGAVTSESTGSNEQLTELFLENRIAARRQAFLGAGAALGVAAVIAIVAVQLRGGPASPDGRLGSPVPAAQAPVEPKVTAQPVASAAANTASTSAHDPKTPAEESKADEPKADEGEDEEPKKRKRKRRRRWAAVPAPVPAPEVAQKTTEAEPAAEVAAPARPEEQPPAKASPPSEVSGSRSDLGGRW